MCEYSQAAITPREMGETTMTDNEALWSQFSDPINLPLVSRVAAIFRDNPNLSGASTPSTLTVQLDTLGGKHLHLPLTLAAAAKLAGALAVQLQLLGYPIGSESPEPPKAQ